MCCRGSLLPDPRYDAVRCIVMALMGDDEVASDLAFTVRMLLWDEKTPSTRDGLAGTQVGLSRVLSKNFTEWAARATAQSKEWGDWPAGRLGP